MKHFKFRLHNQFLLIAMISFTMLYAAFGQVQNIQFKKKEIQIGKSKVVAEMATTDAERMLGLMHRRSLGENYGMLFVFEREKPLNFWMKNTFISLSIGFFDKNKVLVDIQDMEAVKSEYQSHIPSYQSKKPAQYALEVNRGWFKANKVKLGDKLKIDQTKAQLDLGHTVPSYCFRVSFLYALIVSENGFSTQRVEQL